MSRPEVIVVRTGLANTASVLAGLERAGAAPRLDEDPAVVASAGRVVLPGVGAFGAAMERLRAAELVDVLRERVTSAQPTLAVCLGLQLLCSTSAEDPGVEGLGVLPVAVEPIPVDDVRVPQLGWNRVEPDAGCALLEPGWAYFAHSFRVVDAPLGWSVARTGYAGEFVSACEKGPVLACQFHPELSGSWGAALLERWVAGGASC